LRRVGFVGLGDMGLGMARNLVAAGFEVRGFDLRAERRALLDEIGGQGMAPVEQVADGADTVLVMVLNGTQALAVAGALAPAMRRGATLILSATIKPSEAKAIESVLVARGISMIDAPVSGGRAGADGGTLTLMLAATAPVLAANRDVLEAISGTIHHVGETIGQGQTVKAALQAIFGCTFAGIYEALVLGAKAGVGGQTMLDVFGTAACASPVLKSSIANIIDRRLENTGSGIRTMHKDLSVTIDMSREVGAAMFTTAAAYELFQAAKTKFPDGDNQIIVRLLEEIADTEVRR